MNYQKIDFKPSYCDGNCLNEDEAYWSESFYIIMLQPIVPVSNHIIPN